MPAEVNTMLWDDDGPISQGKILTAVMQDREGEARKMLDGWSKADLAILIRAAYRLAALATHAETMKGAPHAG